MMSAYVVKCKQLTDEEIKEAHRKKLLELSLKSLGEIPQLEEPDYEQKAWLVRKMRRSFI
jgi:hypothetical protein